MVKIYSKVFRLSNIYSRIYSVGAATQLKYTTADRGCIVDQPTLTEVCLPRVAASAKAGFSRRRSARNLAKSVTVE